MKILLYYAISMAQYNLLYTLSHINHITLYKNKSLSLYVVAYIVVLGLAYLWRGFVTYKSHWIEMLSIECQNMPWIEKFVITCL